MKFPPETIQVKSGFTVSFMPRPKLNIRIRRLPSMLFDNIHSKGACKYYISALGMGGGSEGNAYFAYVVRGGWGVLRQNAYVTDLNSYFPEKDL